MFAHVAVDRVKIVAARTGLRAWLALGLFQDFLLFLFGSLLVLSLLLPHSDLIFYLLFFLISQL